MGLQEQLLSSISREGVVLVQWHMKEILQSACVGGLDLLFVVSIREICTKLGTFKSVTASILWQSEDILKVIHGIQQDHGLDAKVVRGLPNCLLIRIAHVKVELAYAQSQRNVHHGHLLERDHGIQLIEEVGDSQQVVRILHKVGHSVECKGELTDTTTSPMTAGWRTIPILERLELPDSHHCAQFPQVLIGDISHKLLHSQVGGWLEGEVVLKAMTPSATIVCVTTHHFEMQGFELCGIQYEAMLSPQGRITSMSRPLLRRRERAQ
mmetsp:Transcript_6163/g.18764  ORF Transcript_6163/g.18764 Transcript_6163/m.18764 type:complete len:267 (+) Transcript_6163:923-1723(+)